MPVIAAAVYQYDRKSTARAFIVDVYIPDGNPV
jgi:hypothetical protein